MKIGDLSDHIFNYAIKNETIKERYLFFNSDVSLCLDFLDKAGMVRVFSRAGLVLTRYECYEPFVEGFLKIITNSSRVDENNKFNKKSFRTNGFASIDETMLFSLAADINHLISGKDKELLCRGVLEEMISVNLLYRISDGSKNWVFYPLFKPVPSKHLKDTLVERELSTQDLKIAYEIAHADIKFAPQWTHYHLMLKTMIRIGMNSKFELERLYSNGASFSYTEGELRNAFFVHYKENDKGLIDLIIYYAIDSRFYGIENINPSDTFTKCFSWKTGKKI